MIVSLALIANSYRCICAKEKSWINWYTFPAFITLTINYILPGLYLWIFRQNGSYFAYTYCYLTYACASLSLMFGYRLVRSAPSRATPAVSPNHNYTFFPWILLATSILLYLPILIEFRELLLFPREIYMRTRTGYGIEFFGSSLLMYLALITYLFKQKKSLLGGVVLGGVCIGLIYLHGSKGELLELLEILILYRVYILRRPVTFASAVASVAAIALVGCLSFALFEGLTNVGELAVSMAGYSDYTQNAILVIDDPKSQFYWGRLTLEDEIYTRIPRLIMPNKPKDFGLFKLASIYYPEWFQGDTGSPAFGIGEQYADFGVFAVILISLWSVLSGWVAALLVASLRRRPEPGRFVVLLFFAGVDIIPLGSGYLLPETIVLAAALAFVYRHRFGVFKRPSITRLLASG